MQPKKSKQEGFSREKRLLKPEDYKRVFAEPKSSISSYFRVLARTNEQSIPRLGVVVAKKVIRKAVTRNRVKRIIRESFRTHQDVLVGLDIVVLLRRDVMMHKQGHQHSPQTCLAQQWNELRIS